MCTREDFKLAGPLSYSVCPPGLMFNGVWFSINTPLQDVACTLTFYQKVMIICVIDLGKGHSGTKINNYNMMPSCLFFNTGLDFSKNHSTVVLCLILKPKYMTVHLSGLLGMQLMIILIVD